MSLFSRGNKKKKRPSFIDVHSHVSFNEYDHDRGLVIEQMRYAKTHTITVGVDLETSRRAVEIANENAEIYACIGLHPTDTKEEEFDEKAFAELANNIDVVGVGECGLDYYRIKASDKEEKERQKRNFKAQVDFAISEKLPLMLHVRPQKGTMDAYEDVLEILEVYKEKHDDALWGNVHFFVGDMKMAKHFTRLGFTLSFTGVITFSNDYDEIVKKAPLEMLLVETDSPFATPKPFRGQRNEPVHVQAVVKKIAELKELDYKAVSDQLIENTYRVFNIPE